MNRSSSDGGNGCVREGVTGDGATIQAGPRHFDSDASAWLVGEAIARLHADDGEGRGGYQRAIELLPRVEATETIERIFHAAPREDVPLRWSLLYVLAETGDLKAGAFFARAAIEPIRMERDPRACESPYDGEVLVRTMAIEGLARLAMRERAYVELLHKVLNDQPDRALRIEAVKAILAAAPDEAERLGKILPEDLQFALSLKVVRAQALAVEYEQQKVDAVRPMPRLDKTGTRPTTHTCTCC